MAKSRMINTRFWDDNYTSDLDPIEKLLFLYCLTNTSTNISGIYEIPLKKIASETGIDKDMVVKVLARFEEDEKIFYRDGWLIIKNFIRHQNIGNSKVLRGIEIELEKLSDDILNLIQDELDLLGIKPQYHTGIYRKKILSGKRSRIIKRDGGCCLNCGNTQNLEIDHVIPYSKSGSNDDDNLQTLCQSCNLKKGNKTYMSHQDTSHSNTNTNTNTNSNTNSNLTKQETTSSEQSSHDDIVKIIDLFGELEINASNTRWYGNKTQRNSIKTLIEKFGFDNVEKVVRLLPKTNKTKYMPNVTTPYQLEDKWYKLRDALIIKKNDNASEKPKMI